MAAEWANLEADIQAGRADTLNTIANIVATFDMFTGGPNEGVLFVAALKNEARELAEAAIQKKIALSRALHGEAADHAADAIRAGKPNVLTIDRTGSAANREAATGGLDKVPGKHLDEYPPAMFREGGAGASVRAISPSDNMSAGACIGNACRGLPDGARVQITVVD
jgi:filamentous hemagglutinin